VRILLVENNLSLATLIKTHLSKFHVFDLAKNLEQAHYFLDIKNYDLLLTDLSLPDGKSYELCDYLKENRITLPILFLTAELDIKNKVSCLQNGEDYLLKPFNMLELEAKISNLLEKNSKQPVRKLKNANLKLDHFTHQVHMDDKEIKLNRKEFLLLELFLKHRQQVLSKATLAEKIWQEEEVLFGNSIEMTISHLRKKLGKDMIKTIKGVGYTLNDT